MNRQTITILLILLAAAGSASGQIILGQPASASPQFVYSHWTLTVNDVESSISQSYIPVTGFVPLKDNLEAFIYLASSSNSLDVVGTENSVSGFSDVRLQVNQSLSEDRILISGGLNLPTGKTKLDFGEQWGVIEALSQDFLEFPLRRLGEGFGFNVLVGGAAAVGDARLGGGIMYRFLGEYQPYEESGDYDPGDVISINAGIDIPKGDMTWSATAVYTTYGTDQQDGIKSFKQSPQLALNLSGTYNAEPHSFTGWISYVARGANTFYDTTETVLSELKLYGNEFGIGANAGLKLADKWVLVPSAKFRTIAENEFALGSAGILSIGTALGRELSEEISVTVGFRYFTGTANGDLIDLTGYQLTAGLTAAF